MFIDAADYGLSGNGGLGPLVSRVVQISLAVSDTLATALSESAVVIISASKAGQNYSELGLLIPDGVANFTGRSATALLSLSVSDTLNVAWTEDPVSEQFLTVTDNVRISLGEIQTLSNRIDAVDQLRVSISEAMQLLQVAATLKTANDTVSVSLAESVTLYIELAVSDTLATALGESAVVATPLEVKTASDTLSVSLTEESLLGVFTGFLTLSVSDSLLLNVTDSAVRQDIIVVNLERISFQLRKARIRFELL